MQSLWYLYTVRLLDELCTHRVNGEEQLFEGRFDGHFVFVLNNDWSFIQIDKCSQCSISSIREGDNQYTTNQQLPLIM